MDFADFFRTAFCWPVKPEITKLVAWGQISEICYSREEAEEWIAETKCRLFSSYFYHKNLRNIEFHSYLFIHGNIFKPTIVTYQREPIK
jgi:hypothetical protein